MLIHEKVIDTIPVISIEGILDLYDAKTLKDLLDEKIFLQQYEIVINLDKVSIIDSSGIGAIITAMYKLKKYHGNLKLCNAHGSVDKLFKLIGVNSHLEVLENESAAIASLLAER